MSRLWVMLNGYQEQDLLGECLKSIDVALPDAKVVFIDGAYRDWVEQVKIGAAAHLSNREEALGNALLRFTSPVSTDDTLEICMQHGVDHIIFPPKNPNGSYAPWESEAVKRNTFFQFGEPGDWILWLDCDEMIQGTIDVNNLTGDVWNISLKRDDTIPAYDVMRLFRQQPGIHIEGAHHAVWIGDKLMKKDEQKTLGGCLIYHKFNERGTKDKIRHLAKGFYYRFLCSPQGEGRYRAQHGI